MDNNAEWLTQCRVQIEDRLGWGSSSLWRTDDFVKLSGEIKQSIGVNLSVTTLKRVWGRAAYTHFPASATLNALAQFIGYVSWQAFCDQNPHQSAIVQKAVKQRFFLPKRQLLFAAGFIALAATTWLAFFQIKKPAAVNAVGYTLKSRVITHGLPNSVVFDYNASAAGNAAVTLQQSWDARRTEPLEQGQRQHTSIYYYAGYFSARLLVNGQTVKQTPVFIPTDGWQAVIAKQPTPVYVNAKSLYTGAGAIAVLPEQLETAFSSKDLNNKFVEFDNIRELPGISPRDFTAELYVRSTAPITSAVCRNIKIGIIGTSSMIGIPLADSGCIAGLEVYTGDTVISGKDHDLSAYGCAINLLQHVSLHVANNALAVSLNGSQVARYTMHKPLGQLVGLKILFEGGGEITRAVISSPGKTYDFLAAPAPAE